GKLSSYLLQLSPAFKPPGRSLEELDVLIEALAPVPVAVEFRHRAWLHEERRDATLGWLRDRGAVFVGVDAPQGKPPTMRPPVDELAEEIRTHKGAGCGFEVCETCTQLVPGTGPASAEIVIVGEAPGAREDAAGVPFVGAAGKLLDTLLAEAEIPREAVFITN